jgi:hypothetical protein
MVSVKRTPVSMVPANLSIESEVLCGNVRKVLDSMKPDSIHCAVTSPPYWGLRDYHSDPQVWDGDEACEHEWGDRLPEHHKGQVPQSKWKNNESISDGQNAGAGQFCVKCGAWFGQLGLEPTPDCGRPLMEMRPDLTEKEREYVLGELRNLGLLNRP